MNATRLGRSVCPAIIVAPTMPARAPLASAAGAVAADVPTASQVGAAVLTDGRNAVDAWVAAALATGVVNPVCSGIGGGGVALVWDAHAGTRRVYDFGEVAARPVASPELAPTCDPCTYGRPRRLDFARRGG